MSRRLLSLTWLAILIALPPAARASSQSDGLFPCSHPFRPLGVSIRREYRVTSANDDTAPYRYTESFESGADGAFTQLIVFSNGVRRTARLRCAPGGGLIQESTEIGGATPAAGSKIGTASRVPIALPARDDWKVGERWSETVDLSGTDLPGVPALGPTGGGPSLVGTLTTTSEIAAQEPIQVPAGTFPTFRVLEVSAQKVTVTIAGLGTMPVETGYRGTSWYAEGVGLVRTVSDTFGLTTELVSSTK